MAIVAQLVLLAADVAGDVRLELVAPELDAAGQGVQLLFCEAWDLGQGRVGLEKHGLGWTRASSDRPADSALGRVRCAGGAAWMEWYWATADSVHLGPR